MRAWFYCSITSILMAIAVLWLKDVAILRAVAVFGLLSFSVSAVLHAFSMYEEER